MNKSTTCTKNDFTQRHTSRVGHQILILKLRNPWGYFEQIPNKVAPKIMSHNNGPAQGRTTHCGGKFGLFLLETPRSLPLMKSIYRCFSEGSLWLYNILKQLWPTYFDQIICNHSKLALCEYMCIDTWLQLLFDQKISQRRSLMTHTVCIPFILRKWSAGTEGGYSFLSAMGIKSSKDWFYVIQVFGEVR